MRPPSIVLSFFVMGAGACSGAANIPDTPDLSELLQSYEHPTASLDPTAALSALESSPPLKELAAGFQAAASIFDNVNQASTASSTKSGTLLRLRGSLVLGIRCPGDGSRPNYDESVNGSVSLTLAVADNQIRRAMGGQAKACVLKGTVEGLPARIEIQGPMAFDVGRDIIVGQAWSGELLASFPGELHVDEYVFRSISGRLTLGRFQYLVRMSDGTTLVFEVSEAGTTIRDASGVWSCTENEPCAKQ